MNKKFHLFALLFVASTLFIGCGSDDPTPEPQPPTPPVIQTDTINVRITEIANLQTWLNALPNPAPNPVTRFYDVTIANNINVSGTNGAMNVTQFEALQQLSSARTRRDVRIAGLWNGDNRIVATDSIHITPQTWAQIGRMPLGGSNFWSYEEYIPTFGEFAIYIRNINPSFERVGRMTDAELFAAGGTIIPDTIELTTWHYTYTGLHTTTLLDVLPPRAELGIGGQYKLITNDFAFIDITYEQLMRFCTAITRYANISSPNADIRLENDLIFNTLTTQNITEDVMWRALAIQRNHNPELTNSHGQPPGGRPTIIPSGGTGRIVYNITPESRMYWNGMSQGRQNNAADRTTTMVTFRSLGMREILHKQPQAFEISLAGTGMRHGITVVMPDSLSVNLNSNYPAISNVARRAIFDLVLEFTGVQPIDWLPIWNQVYVISESCVPAGQEPRDIPITIGSVLEYYIEYLR